MLDIVNEIMVSLSKDLSHTVIIATYDIYDTFKIADEIAVFYERNIIFMESFKKMAILRINM